MNKPSTILTRTGEQKLKEELDNRKAVTRKEIAEKIKVALSFGDLSENSEYNAALEEKDKNESRIAEITAILAHAQIIDDEDISTDKVGIGTIVTLLDVELNKEMKFHIVGTKEADFAHGKMSDESPIGKAITGHAAGETIDVETPSGTLKFTILDISKEDRSGKESK